MPSMPKVRRIVIAFLATAGVWPAATVLAQVYKWTDADGQVHYSDRQPPADAGQVKVIAAPSGEASQRYMTTIKTLVQRLLQQLSEPGASANAEAQTLALALARQVETDAAPDWGAIKARVESLARLLPPDAAQGSDSPAQTVQQLLLALPAYANLAPTAAAAAAQDRLKSIRDLAETLAAERQVREAERAALEEQQRQARQSAQSQQPAPSQSNKAPERRYLFERSDPCYLYPNRCFQYPQPPVIDYPQPPVNYSRPPIINNPQSPVSISPRPPSIPPPPRERPYRPCPPPSQPHRGASSWQAGC